MAAGFRSVFPSLVGTELGGFTIVQELATGGMGTVFLGQRMGLAGFGQPAAIKVIHPHMAQDRGFVEMFVDEARIASCVHHPNVCAVLDFGKARGTFYMAMEYLLGETWSVTLRALNQDPREQDAIPLVLAHVIAQACEGLHAAHEATCPRGAPLHIVHRDVSPQNLFVGYDGGVRVLDFGIASAADRLHTTRFGTVKGRYSYMAPEQMLGDSVDRRSDIWSLGVMLREGLTGQSVFRRATDAETVYAVTHRLLPMWERRVHPELRRIADKAMQWDAALRYQSARDMGCDLMRFVRAERGDMGMAELSLCMHRLFGGRIGEKQSVLRRAANDNGALAPTLSLPPPAAPQLQEECTTVEWRAPELSAEGPTTPEPRFDFEAPTWERELTPTLVREQPRRTTTQELMTFSLAAPARDSGRMSAWSGLLLVAASMGLVFASVSPQLEPTHVVISGTTHAASAGVRETKKTDPLVARPSLPAVTGAYATATVPAIEPTPTQEQVAASTESISPLPVEELPQAAGPALLPSVEFAAPLAAQPLPHAEQTAGFGVRHKAASGVSMSRAKLSLNKERMRRKLVAVQPVAAPGAAETGPVPTGKLNIITVNGWADVYLGSKKLGTTPGQLELPRGTHTLTLRENGAGIPQRETVQITAGEVTRARITLHR